MKKFIIAIGRTLEKCANSTADLLNSLAKIAIIAAFLLIIISVFMRYVLNKPIALTENLGGALTLVVVYASAAKVFAQDKHLRVSVLTDRLPVMGRNIAEVIVTIVGIFYMSILSAYVLKMMADVYSSDIHYATMDFAPVWPAHVVMLAGIVIMDIIMCIYLVKKVFLLFKHNNSG